MNKKLLVIIPVFNQLFYTKQCIESIRGQDISGFERVDIMVVDNASTDDTRQWLESEEYEFAHIINKENLGYAKAINEGLRTYRKHVENNGFDTLVMNNDMQLEKNCFEELKKASEGEKIGVVGGKLFFPDGTVQHAGAFLNGFGWGQHKLARIKDGDSIFWREQIEEQEYVTGALFYITKEALLEIPEFDEQFSPAYFEEVTYCFDIRRKGFKVVYTPFARAIHYENVTSKSIYGAAENVKKTLSDTNQVKFYKKEFDNYPKSSANYVALKNKLLMSCKISGEWSFSIVMRNLAKGLNRNNVDVSIAPEEYHNFYSIEDWEIKEMILKPNDYWNRAVLRSSEGDHMYLMPPGKKRIAHTTGESTELSPMWKEQLNSVDLVVTTSSFFENVLKKGGVTTPVKILPNSVDINKFNSEGPKLEVVGLKDFNFFSSFHFGERKGPEFLIQAYVEEFSATENVCLFLHSLSIEHALAQKNLSVSDWIEQISKGKKHAPILLSYTYLKDESLIGLMRNFDVNILSTRAEGFGNTLIEAASLGIPTIATNYSGVTDFLDNDVGWGIDYILEDIPLQILPYFKNYIGGKWAKPSVTSLRKSMREAFENREITKIKGVSALEKVQKYSIENIGKLAKEIIFEE